MGTKDHRGFEADLEQSENQCDTIHQEAGHIENMSNWCWVLVFGDSAHFLV